MQYRKAQNVTTSHSPSMLFLGREIRTRIDLLSPNLKERVEDKLRKNRIVFKDREFEIGDKVAVRDYRATNAKWMFATIVNRDGQLHYTVNANGKLLRRHTDQIRSIGSQTEEISQVPEANPKACPGVQESFVDVAPKDSEVTPLQVGSSEEEKFTCQVVDSTQGSTSTIQDENATTTLRRSTRNRRPPDRLEMKK